MRLFSLLGLLLLSTNLLASPVHLKEKGWTPEVKKRLEALIQKGKGKQRPVVFDFDNTLLCRDIGDATFETLAQKNIVTLQSLPESITPKEVLRDNLLTTYDAFLSATTHQSLDKASYLNDYGWLVQIMAGLSPQQIIDVTKEAYNDGKAQKPIEPFLYPQMMELVAQFIKNDYDVWVISASNAWTIRWMVAQAVNHKLKAYGVQKGIEPSHVIGITTLLSGPEGKLYKDSFLALENSNYAALDKTELQKYVLTSHLVQPMSSHFGKAANILQWIQKTPYFVAGDSPNDHGMLPMGTHKLWIARLESPKYQEETLNLAKKTQFSSWLFQPTLIKDSPGFVSKREELSQKIYDKAKVETSLNLLKKHKALVSFD